MSPEEAPVTYSLTDRRVETRRLMDFFAFEHLPRHLQAASVPCARLAEEMVQALPDSPELTVGLRKLLEAKDCFVRAALADPAAD
jgi:hypothetical protein